MADDAFIVIDYEAFVKSLELTSEAASLAARSIVKKGGSLIARLAKQRFISVAGGRNDPPTLGRPTLRSGNLQKSIKVQTVRLVGPGRWKSWTGPSEIYGPRVEFGYVGTDSLGRHYGPPANPAKYPYMEPAVKEAEPGIRAIADAEWAAVARV
jgi:hypothetical protein